MSRLTWIEEIDGWHSGPYQIELAASDLWVCTRRLSNGRVVVEETSGSLTALKASIETIVRRRRNTRKAVGYAMSGLVALASLALTAALGSSLTPLLVVTSSGLALFSVLKAVDCVIARSWESVHLHYQ